MYWNRWGLMKNKKTISRQLNMFMLYIMALIVSIGCIVALSIFFSIYESEAQKNIKIGVKALEQEVIVDNEEELLNITKNLSKVSLNMLEEEEDERQLLFSNYIEYSGSDNVKLVQVYSGDELIFKMNDCRDIDVIDCANEDTDPETVTIVGSEVDGIYMYNSAPILDKEGNTLGKVVVGIQLANQILVENIKNVTGVDATIFSENKRFATTISRDGELQIGTYMDDSVAKVVLEEGREFSGKVDVLGEPYIVHYLPIVDSNKKVVGALFVGKSITALYELETRLVSYVVILGTVLFLFFFLLSRHWLVSHITRPIGLISTSMRELLQGEYGNIEETPVPNSVEIEMLQDSMKVMMKNILDRKRELEKAAYFDYMTELPNRTYLYEKYQNSIRSNISTLTVLYYIDLDNLKYINHLFGQDVGDELLKKVADILKNMIALDPAYSIYKIAGDEFIVCQEGDFNLEQITDVAKSFIEAFDRTFFIDNYNLSITASIGISYWDSCTTFPNMVGLDQCENTLEALYKKAEVAMNYVKSTGKNNYKIFDPIMDEDIKYKAALEQELKQALKHEQLVLFYQPKYNLSKDEFDGFEALVRWNHPTKGLVSPSKFISVAEESNLISEIGLWVLKKSCIFIKEFNEQHNKDFIVAVNASAVQLMDDGFEDSVFNVIKETGVNPQHLELEITESLFVSSLDLVFEKLNFFRNMEISIALDDFGTGYSSLTYLKTLPITTLKLDKTFIDDIVSSEVSLTIVKSVIQIAKSTGLKIIVEGVETKEQLNILSTLGCDYIQGFYFSKPIPEEEIATLFAKDNV